jgi:2-hydroxyglutarate dehydrogenase
VTLTASDPPAECDLVVVGAGIVGLATACELLARHPEARLVVLEREARVAAHQTGHSSGVIHAGIYYRPGSLKARLCVEGARLLYDYCEKAGIPTERHGKLIVAAFEEELPRLDELERRGRANGVEGLRRLEADEIAAIEPHARGIAALHSPNTGVVDFAAVAASLAEDVRAAGGTIVTSCPVEAMRAGNDRLRIDHHRGSTVARAGIACAGLWSDRLARASGGVADPRIVPFRGAYLRLRPERAHLVRGSVYAVPDPELPFLGVHLTRQIDGTVSLGPTAHPVLARDAYRARKVRLRDARETLSWPGSWRMAASGWRAGLYELRRSRHKAFVAEASRYVPTLRPEDFTAGPSGVRAQALARDGALLDDFVVERTERAVHVRNAPSPAATSALALAKLIADCLPADIDLE